MTEEAIRPAPIWIELYPAPGLTVAVVVSDEAGSEAEYHTQLAILQTGENVELRLIEDPSYGQAPDLDSGKLLRALSVDELIEQDSRDRSYTFAFGAPPDEASPTARAQAQASGAMTAAEEYLRSATGELFGTVILRFDIISSSQAPARVVMGMIDGIQAWRNFGRGLPKDGPLDVEIDVEIAVPRTIMEEICDQLNVAIRLRFGSIEEPVKAAGEIVGRRARPAAAARGDAPGTATGRLRDKLRELGVAVEYWGEREEGAGSPSSPSLQSLAPGLDDPADVRESKKEVYAKLKASARHHARDLKAEEIGQRLDALTTAAKDGDPAQLPEWCVLLVFFGDALAERGADEDALACYQVVVDLAPSPQVQVEVGYLLARRGDVTFPIRDYAEARDALLLLPSKEARFQGLKRYEILDESLANGPLCQFESRIRSLALEAYGRVYSYYLSVATSGRGERSLVSDARRMQPLVIDGLAVLLDANDQEDIRGAYAAYRDWLLLVSGHGPRAVDERLRVYREYMQGFRRGKETEAAVNQAIAETRKTQFVSDPDAFADAVAERVVRQQSPSFREAEGQFREQVAALLGRASRELPLEIVDVLAQGLYAESHANSGAAHLGTIIMHAKAVEAVYRVKRPSKKRNLGLGHLARELQEQQIPVRQGCDSNDLASGVLTLSRKRNHFAHGGPAKMAMPSSQDVNGVNRLVFGESGLIARLWHCL